MSDEKSELWPKIPQDDLGWLRLEVRPSEETGKWYWRVVSPEGKVLSKSGGFDSKDEAVALARRVEEGSFYKYVFEVIDEPAGKEQIFDPQRFPSLREQLKDDFEAIRVAKEVIFRKWPELVDLVGTNSVAGLARLSYLFYIYATEIVKGPWPEGEAAIASCQKVAATYPKNDEEIVQYAENTAKIVAMYSEFKNKAL